MERRFIRSSTYETSGSELRLQKLQVQRTIIGAYSNWLIRWYCRLRFSIINIEFLDTLEQHLSPTAKVLDIGCGFGLFSLYYAALSTGRTIVGFDLSALRIKTAQDVAAKLNIHNVSYACEDAGKYQFVEQFDAVVTLDLLHHVSSDVANNLVAQAFEALKPNGVLLIKDVDTRPKYKLWFTYILDKLMMLNSPVHYRSSTSWVLLLKSLGFAEVYAYPLNDYLPYPHVLIVARKGGV